MAARTAVHQPLAVGQGGGGATGFGRRHGRRLAPIGQGAGQARRQLGQTENLELGLADLRGSPCT